jgi:hypothetical protein
MPAQIYKVCPREETERAKVYVGSTGLTYLSQRYANHVYQYKRRETAPYISSFDVFDEYGIDNCKIELLEELPEDVDLDIIREREKYWIETIPNTVNLRLPMKKKTAEQKAEYSRNYATEWYKKHPDVKKKYYQENKEQFQSYYTLHRDKILEYAKEQVQCPICNRGMCRTSMSVHLSRMHDTNIKDLKTANANANANVNVKTI